MVCLFIIKYITLLIGCAPLYIINLFHKLSVLSRIKYGSETQLINTTKYLPNQKKF